MREGTVAVGGTGPFLLHKGNFNLKKLKLKLSTSTL